MKKVSIVLFFFTLIVSAGCNKTVGVEDKTSTLDANSIAKWHNKVLENFYPNGQQPKQNIEVDYKQIRNKVINFLNKESPNLFNLEQMELNALESDNKISEIGLSLNTPKEFLSQLTKPLDYMKTKGFISQMLHDKLVEICLIQDKEIGLQKVTELSQYTWSPQDKVSVETVVSVYKASYDFWSSRQADVKTVSFRMNCNSACICADTVGGLYGLLCGPVCSIVEAGLFSLVAANGPACN